MVSGKSIYSYGPSPQADLRSDDFDDDPAPIKVESAYIRAGSTITDNEQVDEYRFEATGSWLLTGGATIQNNQANLSGISTLSQNLSLVAGRTYTLRFDIDVNVGDVVVQVQQNAVDILNQTIAAGGYYEFDFEYTTTLPVIIFTTADGSDDSQVLDCSIIERGLDRLELPDGRGSDYMCRIIDQTEYNRRFTKGTGGRPYRILFDRGYEIAEIRFDNSAVAGDILVMDVLVDRTTVPRLDSTIRLNTNALKWLRYALADEMAGEYGKSLTVRQMQIMKEANDRLVQGTWRRNRLRVDRGLRERPSFDINRGDP